MLSRSSYCLILLVLALAQWSANASAIPGIQHGNNDTDNFRTGLYRNDVEDIRVKIPGGFLKSTRSYVKGQWFWNRRWSPLTLKKNTSGQVYEIKKAGAVYGNPNAKTKNSAPTDEIYVLKSDSSSSTRSETIRRDGNEYVWEDTVQNQVYYDLDGNIKEYVDFTGLTLSFRHDGNGNLKDVIGPNDTVYLSFYYESYEVTAGSTTETRYRVKRILDLTSRGVEYFYTDNQLTSVKDVLGYTWTYQYKNNHLHKIITPELNETIIEVSPGTGRLLSIFDNDGVGYQYEFKTEDGLVYQRTTDGENRIVESWFNSLGIAERIDVNGETVSKNRLISSVDTHVLGEASLVNISTDTQTESSASIGVSSTVGAEVIPFVEARIHTNRQGQETNYIYDESGRLKEIHRPDVRTKQYVYDSATGNIKEVINYDGSTTAYNHFPNGLVFSITQDATSGKPSTTEYSYTDFGYIDTITKLGDENTKKYVENYTWDELGNLIQRNNTNGEQFIYADEEYPTFTVTGNHPIVKDINGNRTRFEYDAVGNLLKKTDPLDRVTYFVYDKEGRLKEVTKPNKSKTTYTYNAQGLIRTITNDLDQVIEYQYNKANQLKKKIFPGNRAWNYAYNSEGLLEEVSDPELNKVVYKYEKGLLKTIEYPRNTTTYSYSINNQVAGILQENLTSTLLRQQSFTYDALGALDEFTNYRTYTTDYDYDSLLRLVRLEAPNNDTSNFDYDNRGNLIALQDAEERITQFDYWESDRVKSETKTLGPSGIVRLPQEGILILGQADNDYIVSTDPITREELDQFNWQTASHVPIYGDINGDGLLDLLLQPENAGDSALLLKGSADQELPTIDRVLKVADYGNISTESGTTLELTDINDSGHDDLVIRLEDGSTSVAYSDSTGKLTDIPESLGPGGLLATIDPNSLSTGVGATSGSFSVSSAGKPNYVVPIMLPPSVQNIAPSLSLVYSGLDSTDLLGVGWYLNGITEISRCPTSLDREGYIVGGNYNDYLTDQFCLNGQRLIEIQSITAYREYRTEQESFTRVRAYGPKNNPTHFVVWNASGAIDTYGQMDSDNAKRINKVGQTAVWYISKTEDRFGNDASFDYYNIPAQGAHYIRQISFGDNSVVFAYENRTDVTDIFTGGYHKSVPVRLDKITTYVGTKPARSYDLDYEYGIATGRSRLQSITECPRDLSTLCLNPTTFQWDLVEPQVMFAYQGESSLPVSRSSTFAKQQYHIGDINGDGRNDLVWTYRDGDNLGWSLFTANTDGTLTHVADGIDDDFSASFLPSQFDEQEANKEKSHQFLMGDVNGDGKSDLVWMATYLGKVYRNLYLANAAGTGFDAQGYQVYELDSPSAIDHSEYRLSDVNGDGRQDIVWSFVKGNQLGLGVFLAISNNGNIGFANTYLDYTDEDRFSVNFYKNHSISTGDVNGDGKGDVVWNFTVGEFYYRVLFLASANGAEFYESSVNRFSRQEGFGSVINLQPYMVDINADGKADQVVTFIDNSGLEFYIYRANELGLGFEYVNHYVDSSVSRSHIQPSVTPADLNGDGHIDFLYTYQSTVTTFNWKAYLTDISGTKFAGTTSGSQSSLGDQAGVINPRYLTGDLNADGKTDLLWAYGVGDTLYQQTFTLPTSYPDHITKITDGQGYTTNVKYTYLSQAGSDVYIKGTDAQYPYRDDIGRSYVVESIKSSNGIGGQNEWRYRYEGARTHLRGRGFAGFKRRVVTDMQTGFVTYETYNQAFPLIGQLRSSETYHSAASDADPITRSFYNWDVANVNWNGQTTLFPNAKGSIEVKYDLESGARVSVSMVLNQYNTQTGNLEDQIKYAASGVTVGSDLTEFSNTVFDASQLTGVVQTTHDEFVFNHENTTDWRIGFVSDQTTTYASPGDDTRVINNTYTPYNNTSGKIGSQTFLKGSTVWATETSDYYANGNKKSVVRSAANGQDQNETYRYTPNGLFLEEAENSYSHVIKYQFNAYTGAQRRVTDANGLHTHTLYDDMGRLVLQINQDGSAQKSIYTQGNNIDGVNLAVTKVVTTLTHTQEASPGAPETVTYYDILGRTVRSESQGFASSQTILQTSQYDARGRVSQQSIPYFSGSTPQWHFYDYDDFDRVIEERRPDGSVTNTNYTSTATGPKTIVTETIKRPSQSDLTVVKHQQYDVGGFLIEVIDDVGGANVKTELGYDAQGNMNWTRVDNNDNTIVSATYDLAGNRTDLVDPNAGAMTTLYDGHGHIYYASMGSGADGVVVETDYDKLGRIERRTDTWDGQTQEASWTYDSKVNGKGLVATITGPDFFEEYEYDTVSRINTVSTKINNETNPRIATYTYDGYSRPLVVQYPSNFSVLNVYNSRGYLHQVKDFLSPGTVYRETLSMDAWGNVTQYQLGNGLITTETFSSERGWLTGIQTGTSTSNYNIQNLAYSRDSLGNIYQRTTQRVGEALIRENFSYDNLFRLRSATTDTGLASGTRTINYGYDNLGNIKTKSDVSDVDGYTYGGNGGGVHAVSAVTKNGTTKTYHYDTRGNVITSGDRTITYTAFNKPNAIIVTPGVLETLFQYGPDRKRIYQSATSSGKTITTRYYHGGSYEVVNDGTNSRQKSYLGDYLVHTLVNNANGEIQYLHRDHLGSTDIITKEDGTPVQRQKGTEDVDVRMAFDPFGGRRDEGWEDPDAEYEIDIIDVAFNTTTKGFTGHEHLDGIGLIHMNGRVYDPEIGRFLSIDQYIQDPTFSQSHNRYSYVWNNPLAHKDPDGEFIMFIIPAIMIATTVYDVATAAIDAHDLYKEYEAGNITNDELKSKLGDLAIEKGTDFVISKATMGLSKLTKLKKVLPDKKPGRSGGSDTAQPKAKGTDKATDKNEESGAHCSINGCKCSFEAGTPVTTPDGLVAIETLQQGDWILARDEETGEQDYRKINHAYSHEHDDGVVVWIRDREGNVERIVTTSEHPFYVVGVGFLPAIELAEGMSLIGDDQEVFELAEIDKTPFEVVAFNFEVDGFHTYFVGRSGVWVHNECGDGYEVGDSGPHREMKNPDKRADGNSSHVDDGRVQSHHPIQNAWAKKKYGSKYNENDAPTILLKTTKGEAHHKITYELQKDGVVSKTLREEFNRGYKHLKEAGVDTKSARKAIKKAYKYFEKITDGNFD